MRVVLVSPPAREPVRSPLLAMAYLVSALRRQGHEALVVDAAAPLAEKSPQAIARQVAQLQPDLVGVHIKTLEAQPAYAVAGALSELGVPLVAGGPHATVCAAEALRNGFDYVVRGEAEETLPALADALERGGGLDRIAGLSYVQHRMWRHTPDRPLSSELDSLPDPLDGLDAFDPELYGSRPVTAPAGLLSSRGCPAACTFCANNVTGRKFRYHSVERVVAEVERLRDEFGQPALAFFDDSFAVGQARMAKLCAALEGRGVSWTCTAHPSHLSRQTLELMVRAGCTGVDMGIESGDPGRLVRIGKGVTTERVLDVLAWARDLGLHTVVNLMVGWPEETTAELEATLGFIERAAPLAGGFNARGVLVPHPGTEIYDQYHERFGFTEWWLREPPIEYLPFPTEWSPDEVIRAYASDAALERNFFDHSAREVELMNEVLKAKALHTYRRLMSWGQAAPSGLVPAAGAR